MQAEATGDRSVAVSDCGIAAAWAAHGSSTAAMAGQLRDGIFLTRTARERRGSR
jgi:hypothetical protein